MFAEPFQIEKCCLLGYAAKVFLCTPKMAFNLQSPFDGNSHL